jgi:translocation and assembly module TamB
MIRTSSDVVIIDQPPPGPASYSMDIQVRIILGDKVVVKAGGIEARLEGNMDLQAAGIQSEQMTGRGEIRVKEGSYTGYGLRLRIDRGRFLFAGGPIDNPALDILALRRDDDLERLSDIKVGVLILGNLKRPTVKLYSIPAMKDEDILSYLLEGRPYDRQSANLGLLRAGAEALLAGDSPGPVDKLKSKIGIDRVDIESQSGDLSRSMVTIGKYLTPKLYLSYGYSLFDSEQVLKVRYRISKSWEVEAQRGTAAAVDLYYRIDFF